MSPNSSDISGYFKQPNLSGTKVRHNGHQEACVRTQDYYSGPCSNQSQAMETRSVGGLVPWWFNQQSIMVYSLVFDFSKRISRMRYTDTFRRPSGNGSDAS